jgi:glutaredoxin
MRFPSWLKWFRPTPAPRLSHLRVTLFTRQGCHLCEDAGRLLRIQQARFGFPLEEVDVDTDGDLAARYGEWVPVVTVNGKVRFRGGVNPVLLDRLLQAEARTS